MFKIFLVVFLFALSCPAAAQQPAADAVIVPLDQPNMTSAEVAGWAAEAVAETMTFDHTNHQRELQQSSRYFTKAGWESFAAAMQRSRIIDKVTHEAFAVTARAAQPEVTGLEPVDGKYRWRVTFPLELSHRNEAGERKETLRVQLIIERVAAATSPAGVGIAEWTSQ